MDKSIPRLRMVAGPNGSGKSTIKSVIDSALWGIYINPDEIESEIKKTGAFDLKPYGIESSEAEIDAFFRKSALFEKDPVIFRFQSGKLLFGPEKPNSYLASALAEFLRDKLLSKRISFTFETVMSHPDKIAILNRAKKMGYRTYLYYIATQDPEINISRVRFRVSQGGHDVPSDKIESRYYRSLDLLADAIRATDRAYIFDNSSHTRLWVAEITNGKDGEIMTDKLPPWFKTYVLDKAS